MLRLQPRRVQHGHVLVGLDRMVDLHERGRLEQEYALLEQTQSEALIPAHRVDHERNNGSGRSRLAVGGKVVATLTQRGHVKAGRVIGRQMAEEIVGDRASCCVVVVLSG